MNAATARIAAMPRSGTARGMRVGQAGLPDGRERVLIAAAAAFMERGYSGTSIDDIAGFMGATKGAVYHHFASKSDVYFAVQDRAICRIDSLVRPIFESTLAPDAKLMDMARAHALAIFSDFRAAKVGVQGLERSLMQAAGIEERRRFKTILRQRQAYEEMFKQVIRHGMDEGVFASAPVAVVASGLLGALNWTTVWFDPNRKKSPAELEVLAQSLATYAVRGVLADQGAPVSSSRMPEN